MKLRSIKNIPRIGDIAATLIKHGLHHFAQELGLPQVRKAGAWFSSRPSETWEDVNKSLPMRIRGVLQDLGPTYVKLGQILSTRHDLLGEDFIEELSKLQDSVPAMPFEEVRKILKSELSGDEKELFDSFDRKPLAAASIGQVHRAVTKDGRQVVVKVQRPGIGDIIASDIAILKSLAEILKEDAVFDEMVDPVEIVSEFSRSIKYELDYHREARNIAAFRHNFRNNDQVYIPEVIPGLSSDKVLCMEFIDGVKATSVTPETHDCRKIAAAGVAAVLQQVFIDGCFHADPHPGNILINKDGVVCFVDFGMVGRLSSKIRENLSSLLFALACRDYDLLARELVRVSGANADVSIEEYSTALMEAIDPYYGASLDDVNVGKLIQDCLDTAARFKIRFPANYSLMLKSLITVEGLGKHLDPDFDMMAAARPFVERLVFEGYSPERLKHDAFLAFRDFAGIISRAPYRMEAILTRMQRGEFSVEFKHKGLAPLLRNIDEGSNRLAFSLVISALIIGSSLIMSRPQATIVHGLNLGMVMFSIAGLLGMGLAVSIVRSGRM